MKKLLDNITAEVTKAFVEAGYEEKFGKVTLSNRPDLCEFQCNGAMAAAKQYKKAPVTVARRLPSQRRSSWITAEPMWQNHCMWDIFVPQLSVRV